MLTVEINKIILNAKNGNQLAYTQLLNYFWGDVYRFLNAKCANEHESEDLTIKTFSKAFDKLETFDPHYSFKNWLLTIANNLYIDFFRSQKNGYEEVNIEEEKILKIPDENNSAEDQLIQEQQLTELLQHLKNLKPHYREVINLRYFQEFSIKEISESIGEPINNVKVKLLRARNLLSEMIKKEKIKQGHTKL